MSRFGWWFDLPYEPHIRDALDDRKQETRRWEVYVNHLSVAFLAELIHKGFVTSWPHEFTALGRHWYRGGAQPARVHSRKEPECESSSPSSEDSA